MARKILLADDSVTAQNMGRKILTDAGYEVVTVNNGSAALKKIAEGKPDLIVLDVYMPGYSGLEVCQRIKENRETARIPILLTVGKLEPFKPEEARRARADAFVVKPFEASELLSALTKLEDKIIPGAEPYKQGRFAKAVASVDQDPDGEKFGDSEGGWKARLRIPTGKPKSAEPPVDYATTQGKGVRDYVETPGKNVPPPPPVSSTMPDRPLPTGIPHDITPEEIAAITAAAAQLNGTAAAPTAQQEADHTEVPAVESLGSEAEQESPQESAPVTFASSPVLAESVEAPVDLQATIVAQQDSSQPEVAEVIPVDPVVTPIEAAPEVASVVPSNGVVEEPPTPPVMPAAEIPVEAVSELARAPIAETHEPPAAAIERTEPFAPATETLAPEASSEVAISQSPVANADDEVMAALQTLIPNSENAGSATTAPLSNSEGGTFPMHPAHPRWVAEQVSLPADETTISLEQEMAVAYGTFSGNAAHAAAMPAHEHSLSEAANATIAQEPTAQTTGHAMASAAGMGEGASAYSGIIMQSAPEPPATTHSAESAPPVPEITDVAASPVELPPEAIPSIEGEIMAASWKNIRDSIAGAAAKPALTKEEFRDLEQAPSTRNSSSAPDQSSQQSKASDPTAIANIVDSVLAELRPKIVEEIARKLADPKKE